MKAAIALATLVLSLASVSLAQSYSQVQPHACMLADYNCNSNPLIDPSDPAAAYSFGGGNQGIVDGGYFSLVTDAGTFNGSITNVGTQAPALQAGNSGPFEFSFELSNGKTGTVNGQISVSKVCHRYCYPYATIESATVTLN